MTAVESLVNDARRILEALGPDEWSVDSACHGWRVQDVVTHMAFFFHTIADPQLPLPPNPGGTTESLNDAAVNERADWSPQQALEYYIVQAECGLAALRSLENANLGNKTIRLNELGSYRLTQLADAVAFDHLVHLTSDLLQPHGPLAERFVNVGTSIDPAIDWMVAGLPQMSGRAVHAALLGPVGLRLVGATERSFVVDRSSEGEDPICLIETEDLPPDTATTPATEFLRWATRRSAWRSAVTLAGSSSHVAPVLDAIRVI